MHAFSLLFSLLMGKKLPVSVPAMSISAAFPNPCRKCRPHLQTTFPIVNATIANSRTFHAIQNRQSMSENMASLFKQDPQKKLDKEYKEKVASFQRHMSFLLMGNTDCDSETTPD